MISDIALAAAGEHDLEEILSQTLRRLRRHIRFTGGSIALVEGDELVVKAAIGPFAADATGQRLPRGRGESWRVVTSRQPSIVNDMEAAGLVSRSGTREGTFRSWLAVPLSRRGHGIGLLEVDSTLAGAFKQIDVQILQTVAAVLSGPVELASRYAAEVHALEESREAQRRLAILNAALDDRARQQAAVARLSQAALRPSELQRLRKAAVDLVASTLRVRYAAVFDFVPREHSLRLGAGTGWGRGVVGRLRIRVGPNSLIGYTLFKGEPVVVDDATKEDRFEIQDALQERGVVSAMAVPIQGRLDAFGVLIAHTETPRIFTGQDVDFLLAMANILASAVERARDEEAERKVAELRDAFLGVISHELRTPITTIYGSAKVLRHPNSRLSQDARDEAIADIEAEAERLYRLVEDLLVLSRSERGRLEAGEEPVLLHHLLPRVVASERQRQPALKINVVMPAHLPAVSGEDTYIEQVVRNLLSNAAKYGAPDEPITLVAEAFEDEIVVKVLDEGPGISPDESESMFDLFYRSKRTASRVGGAGIGLFVCRELVEAMGGRIWARPRNGSGSEFGFTLPTYVLPQDDFEEDEPAATLPSHPSSGMTRIPATS